MMLVVRAVQHIGKINDWVPTHRHKKGRAYRLNCYGIDEATREPVAIYEDSDGTIWVRAKREFDDGRFTKIP